MVGKPAIDFENSIYQENRKGSHMTQHKDSDIMKWVVYNIIEKACRLKWIIQNQLVNNAMATNFLCQLLTDETNACVWACTRIHAKYTLPATLLWLLTGGCGAYCMALLPFSGQAEFYGVA